MLPKPTNTGRAGGEELHELRRRLPLRAAAAATVAFPARRIRRDVTAGAEGDDKDAHGGSGEQCGHLLA
jgi:hypothetical protein